MPKARIDTLPYLVVIDSKSTLNLDSFYFQIKHLNTGLLFNKKSFWPQGEGTLIPGGGDGALFKGRTPHSEN